jgi:hypothetical protein
MTKKRTTTKRIEPNEANIKQAVQDLEIDQPIRLVRVVGSRLELHLPYSVLKWPETPAERRKRLAAKPQPKPPLDPREPDDWHRSPDSPPSGKPREE